MKKEKIAREKIYYCKAIVHGITLYLASLKEGLAAIDIEVEEDAFLHSLKKDFPNYEPVYSEEKNTIYLDELMEYFAGKRKEFTIPIYLLGTDFQKKVWHALMKIPYGETATYKDIAYSIQNPKAVRAVGGANNKNRLPIVIPCHRVIGSNNQLVGYGGGLHIKEKLLKIEGIKVIDGKVVK